MSGDGTSPRDALARLGGDRRHGGSGMTLGVELPLDNDFARADPRTPFGIPDLTDHVERAQLADRLGFRAMWLRDVPLWLPRTFGDAGQVFDPIAYLGYLAASTEHVLLGTAAVVLPLRHPLQLAKQAATIDVLSGGRLILGVATGDRPEEYPAFGASFEDRGETYRQSVASMRSVWKRSATTAATAGGVLPAPVQGRIPVVAVGRGGQTTEWAAENMDGYMTYHRDGAAMAGVVAKWNSSTPAGLHKPVITTMLVDLEEDSDAAATPIRFGARTGSSALVEYLLRLESAGIAHVALNFRPSRRPVEDVLREIAETVLPSFSQRGDTEALHPPH